MNAKPTEAKKPKFPMRVQKWVRDSLVAGLIAVAPLVVVWIVIDKLVLSMDGVLGWVPAEWRDDLPIPVLKTPGLGFALSLVLIILVGWIARGLFGRRVVGKVTDGFQQIPILGTIYSAVRQLLEAVFSSQAQSFQRVVMVQFPRAGCYVLGFVTAKAWKGAEDAVGTSMVSVFVPTTPNPTSGFFTMFPEEEVIAMNMTVEEAFKAIMSSGIVQPEDGSAMIDADVGTMTVEMPPVSAQ